MVAKNASGNVVGMDEMGMEIGENSNGHYVRWNNGLMICTREIEYDFSITNSQYFAFPKPFTAVLWTGITFEALVAYTEARARAASTTIAFVSSTSNWSWSVRTRINNISETRTAYLFAIGYWK